MKHYVLDTFSGAGGFSIGFEQAGCKIIGAIEIDKWASETFAYNHPNTDVISSDITLLNDQDLIERFKSQKPTIILGGPPCQGFSVCNKNAGDPRDPRNSLFKEFIRAGSIFKPDMLIMENVPNLSKARTHTKERVLDIIVNELKKIGYFVYTSILNATDYGIPQIRKRLFIIATKSKLDQPFPKATHCLSNGQLNMFDDSLKECPSLWDAISDLPNLKAGEGDEQIDYSNDTISDYQIKLRGGHKILFNHKAMNHTKRMVERFSKMSWGQSGKDAPEHLKPRRRNSKEIARRVYDQNNRRMYPHKPCHTIPASFYANFVHPYQNRNFTAREGARIQSFPDSYFFKGKPTIVSHKLLAREGRMDEKYLCQYNQIGNAVPPILSKKIAVNLLDQLKGNE